MLWASASGPTDGSPSQAREASFEGAELLERLARAGMVERGRVVLIGLDAIKERFGDRWDRKSDLIWQVAMGHIRRRIGPDDLAARVGECEAVIAVAGDSSRAQSLSLAVLSELLVYFLGESTPTALRLHQVLWVEGRNLGCAPIDATTVEPAAFERKTFATDDPVAAHPDWSPLSFQARAAHPEWSALSLQRGVRRLEERFEIEPVISLRHRRLAANRISVRFSDPHAGRPLDGGALAALPPGELLALEALVVDYAFSLPSDGVPLVLPLSFQTLSTSRGRALLLQGGGANGARRPIVEITGLDNAPQSRLVEVVSLIAPACRAVIARIDARTEGAKPRWGQRLEGLRDCRLGGVAVDFDACRDLGRERLAGLVSAARAIAPLAFTFHVPDAQSMAAAHGAGLTHAALKPPEGA